MRNKAFDLIDLIPLRVQFRLAPVLAIGKVCAALLHPSGGFLFSAKID
jgi:hypothetical protein